MPNLSHIFKVASIYDGRAPHWRRNVQTLLLAKISPLIVLHLYRAQIRVSPPMIQATSNGYLQCAQVDVPNIPAEAYGSYGTPYMPPVIRQQIEQAEQQICN